MSELHRINRARLELGLRPLVAAGTMLPPIVSFVDFEEWEHPRGKDGRFIEKNALVRVGENIAGKVEDLRPDGVYVRVTDSPGNAQNGSLIKTQADQIESIDAKASLDAPVPTPVRAAPKAAVPDADVDSDEPAQTTPDRTFRPATDDERTKHVVPKAWSNVEMNDSWSKGDENVPDDKYDGLIAVGRDARGNKQYLYDKRAAKIREQKKFGPDGSVGKTLDNLPAIDAAIRRDMDTNDAAAALSLQLFLGMRVGGQTSKVKKSDETAYGASSILPEHVTINDDNSVTLNFKGKKGVDISLTTHEPAIVDMMKKRLPNATPGESLFKTDDSKVRAYFKNVQSEIGVSGLAPHDLRRALATATAKSLTGSMPKPSSPAEFSKQRREIGEKVSALLGNNWTEALESYIDPKVFDEWDLG